MIRSFFKLQNRDTKLFYKSIHQIDKHGEVWNRKADVINILHMFIQQYWYEVGYNTIKAIPEDMDVFEMIYDDSSETIEIKKYPARNYFVNNDSNGVKKLKKEEGFLS